MKRSPGALGLLLLLGLIVALPAGASTNRIVLIEDYDAHG